MGVGACLYGHSIAVCCGRKLQEEEARFKTLEKMIYVVNARKIAVRRGGRREWAPSVAWCSPFF